MSNRRRALVAAGVGALFFGIIFGSLGLAIGEALGQFIGMVIGITIGWLLGWMIMRRDENLEVAEEQGGIASHLGGAPIRGVSRGDAEVSRARRTEEAATSTVSQPAWNRVDRSHAVNLTLAAEKLEVSKRELDAGLVRLRKVVKTEVVQVPVELRREEIIVERVEPGAAPLGPAEAGAEFIEPSTEGSDEIVIRLVKEEPVVQKEAKVFSEVHVHKVVRTETEHIRETLRHEDVKMERKDF